MLTSTSNAKVKQIVQWQTKAKERKKDKVFLAEGLRMCEESPVELVKEVYLTEDMLEKAKGDKALWGKLKKTGYETVSRDVFAKMSDTMSPQGILTVLRQPEYHLEELILASDTPLFVILENLQDPGNLGAIIRTGEGAGITGVIMSRQTVDIFNPKTIRSTMGSIFRVPFLYVDDLADTIGTLKANHIRVYAAHLKGTEYFHDTAFNEPCAFMIGNEGNGLQKETADLADKYVRIPMEGKVESLNAAIAASLFMYEAYRQRH